MKTNWLYAVRLGAALLAAGGCDVVAVDAAGVDFNSRIR
jgi:hypothetical protein